MLILLSPAKKLLTFKQPYSKTSTRPLFQKKTTELMQLLKQLSVADIAQLMSLSDTLATLNYQRYQHFLGERDASQAYPAVFLFRGDVYQGLDVDHWSEETLSFAQSHLMILSGLYGLLRPLDLIEPYRLEMGTSLSNSCGKNLYDFWRQTITEALNTSLSSHNCPTLINLASQEYFQAVDVNVLRVPLLHIHFKEQKGDKLAVIGVHAKKARGVMASYILRYQIDNVEKIKAFTELGYHFCEKSSDESQFNFVRLAK